ncbi:MAG: DUF4097 family beta strand repeat-containing protein [Streptococcaceae bacterium]|jgi:hypothetical protein|nr:DUF4097 family beta strand repeat-containing protein [Streptococcaceae bacterium]
MRLFRTKQVVVIGAITAAIGGILLFSGFAMGGAKNYITLDNGQVKTMSYEASSETKQLNKNVKNLVIRSNAAYVTVEVGKEFSVKSQLTNRTLQVHTDGDTASIFPSSVKGKVGMFFSFGSFKEDRLTVTVPSPQQLKSLELELNASDASVKGLDLSDLSGEVNATNLALDTVTAQSINFEKANGVDFLFSNLTLKDSGRIKMNAGHLEIENSQLPPLSVSGNASELTIRDNDEIKLPYKESTGNSVFTIDMNAAETVINN